MHNMPRRVAALFRPVERPGRVGAFEGLRAVAMTLIFLGHFESQFRHFLPDGSWSAQFVGFIGSWFHRGVALFFLITGYFV